MLSMAKKSHFLLAIGEEGWYTIREFSVFLQKLNAFLWGVPTLVLILGTGGAITILCGVPQLRLLPGAVKRFFRQFSGKGENGSSYRALCTALAATVGTGNIAGVAGAIAIGGPGAVFWMLLSAFFGMATKFAESTLAVRFRERSEGGAFLGGTMYMIRNGLGRRLQWLGPLYCFFGLFAAFGVGNATQVNAVLTSLAEAGNAYGFSVSPGTGLAVGLLIAGLVVLLVSGGGEKIGRTAEILVPVAAVSYVAVCLGALWLRRGALPGAVLSILRGAFSPEGVTGGAVGSLFQTLRMGVSRGVFTNEAGMGTAAMAHGSASVAHPVEQGQMGIMEVFLDTVLICTLTALVILTSGVEIPYGTEAGAALTARALSAGLGSWISAFVCACLCLFALATILGWGLYAGRCAEFLLGGMNWKAFALCQGAAVILGAVLDTGIVWTLSELMNALMAVPNLIALIFLLPELRRLTIDYLNIKHGHRAVGGTYENFHQRKPLRTLSHAKVPPLRGGSREEGQENLPSEHRSAGPEDPRGLLCGCSAFQSGDSGI